MDNKEAKEIIDKFYDALFKARVAIDVGEKHQAEIKQKLETLKDRDKTIRDLQREMIEVKAKLRGYIQNTDFEVEVCKSCWGCGGFDTPDGGEPCPDCNQRGWVKLEKSHLQTSAMQKEHNSS